MEQIEMAALGRSLFPGMLYDCRNDSIIPGVTLWDKESLSKDLDVHPQPRAELKFSASDSLDDKANLLDVSASLKASFLGGLVEVGGSAKYLNDQKSSLRQSRVTMQYSQTTRFEQLTMTQLGKITYPEVFEEQTATHVVTAVLYGAQAFMVFDYTVSNNEKIQQIDGDLNVMVKKIPSFSIEGKGSIKMDQKQKEFVENVTCTFYGDYELENNPTTYMEALDIYKKLPSLLKEREKDAVPVRVWLYPLAHLDKKAASLQREIGVMKISKLSDIREELRDAERKCKDLIKYTAEHTFQDVKERLKKFQELLGDYMVLFQEAVCKLLPAIRSGNMEEQALINIQLIHQRFLFKADRMKQWLENIHTEIDLLNSYTAQLSGVTIITSSIEFNKLLFDPTVDAVVCFSFTSLSLCEDPYLSAITEVLKVDKFEKLAEKSCQQHTDAWFSNPEIPKRMKENLFSFKSFSETNKDQKKIRFVIAAVSDSSNPGNSNQLYRNGQMVDKFQLVSKPPAPSVEYPWLVDKLVLKMQKSPTGVTVGYRVEYTDTKESDSGVKANDWQFIDTPDAQYTFKVSDVLREHICLFRYRAVSEVGVSEASNSVHSLKDVTIQVDRSLDGSTSSMANELRKRIKPTSWWSLSTIESEISDQHSNISIPYLEKVAGGLKPGMALYFQGVVPPDATQFIIDLMPDNDNDIAFHFNPCINDKIVFNSLRSGNWQSEEQIDCLLQKGSAFDIFIVITSEGYEINVNGQKCGFFRHRMPIENVTRLHISGDVSMNTTGIVSDWSTSTFGKELRSGTSRGCFSNIPSVKQPVCTPSRFYEERIQGGLRPGQALFFRGVVSSDFTSFSINLKTGPKPDDDIPFQFNPCNENNSVICNSFRERSWEKEETSGSPFVKGGVFDILIAVNSEDYKVIVNGYDVCTFKHRMPLSSVSVLHIVEDVFISSFGIIEMDKDNMTITYPGYI